MSLTTFTVEAIRDVLAATLAQSGGMAVGYPELLAGYGLVFVLLIGYLLYLQRRLGRLEDRIRDRQK